MIDTVVTEGKWEFNQEVTNCFDNMLERSIPDYGNMRDLVTRIGMRYVKDGTAIVDLGCSTGEAVRPFVNHFNERNTYELYDVSKPMIEKAREKYKDQIAFVNVEEFDIKNGIPKQIKSSLVLSVLTLMFTPIEYRTKIVQSVYDSLENGSAFILVEKVLGSDYPMHDMIFGEHYQYKLRHGYTREQVDTKWKGLEGVLVPVTAEWNEGMLKNTGFKSVECFWRYLNFAGWVAVK